MKHRIISIITALSLCLSLCPTWAFAVEGEIEILPDEVELADEWDLCTHGERVDDCRICPIEALIAALPRALTEDNAETVRWQLDEILDLWRELSWEEQEQIDLSPCWDLQAALDEANAPAPVEGESTGYRKADWINGAVTYTDETANCIPVAETTTTWVDNGWYVATGTVTISQPITVNGEVNLILADSCTLNANSGIVVSDGNTLNIYAQEGGTGTLNATGLYDTSGISDSASAGIGGGNTSATANSGAITIHGGVIKATGGNRGDAGNGYSAAGIGGGFPSDGDGGSNGTIVIYGGTITADSGQARRTGAGIGGGFGNVNGGAGSDITIYGGTVAASSTAGVSESGAGIGGGAGQLTGGTGSNIKIYGGAVTANSTGPVASAGIGGGASSSGNGGAGSNITISGGRVTATGGTRGAGIGGGGAGNSKVSGNGTDITIGGGEVTAVGGSSAAGIGGGGGQSTSYNSITGGTGTGISIEGGIVDAKGGTNGDPIGNSGTDTVPPSIDNAIVFEGGVGKVYGTVALDGEYTVKDGYTLTFAEGGKFDGNYAFYQSGSPIEMATVKEQGVTGPAAVRECTHPGNLQDNGNGTHGGTCPYCGMDIEAATHTLDNDTKTCAVCKAELKVRVEIGNATTYYGGIGPAWTAACAAESATVTLLDDVTAELMLDVSGGDNITLNGGDYTLSIAGSITVFLVSGGQLNITGGTFIGNSTVLMVQSGTVNLSGGEFRCDDDLAHTISCASGVTLASLLLNYGSPDAAAKHYAYYRDGGPISLVDDSGTLFRTVKVQECEHEGVKVTPNNDGTHSRKCPYCGYTEAAANCSYGLYTIDDGETHSRICTVCGDKKVEAHNLTSYNYKEEGLVTKWTKSCPQCGYSQDIGTLTQSASVVSVTYGQITGDVSVTADMLGGASCDYYWSCVTTLGSDPAQAIPTNLPAGRNTMLCQVNVNESGQIKCSQTFTFYIDVARALLTEGMVTLSPESVTYNGAEQKPTITVKQGSTTLTEGTDYDVAYSTTDFTSAGTIKITVTGKENYEGTVEKSYTIAQATPTIAWSSTSQELTYTGNPAVITAPSVTLVNGKTFSGTINYSYAVGDSTSFTSGLPTDAGTYTIKASVDAEGNYAAADSTNTLTLTINKADVTITPPAAQKLTYTGAPQALVEAGTANVGDVVYSLTETGQYSKTIPTGTNAGDYTVWYKVDGNDNYNGVAPVKVDVTIARKQVTPTVTITPSSYEYNGDAIQPSGSEVKVLDGTDVIPASEYTLSYGENIHYGTVTVTATDNGSGNYSFAAVTGNFAITKKLQAALSITGKPESTVYGDTFTLTADGGSGEGTVTWTVTSGPATVSASGEVQITGVGSVAIKAVKAGGTDYEDAEATLTFEAAKKPITATVTAQSKTYDGTAAATVTASVTDSDLVSGDSITISGLVGTFSDANVGEGKTVTVDSSNATITGTNAGNYIVTFPNTTASISKANAAITAAPAAVQSLTYNGTAQELVNAGTANLGKVVYALSKDGDYSEAIPTGTNAGDYTVWYKVADTDNYNGTEPVKVEVKIEKANYGGATTDNTSAKFGTTATYDLTALLPDEATAGTPTTSDEIFDGTPSVSGKTLTYKLKADAAVGSTGTITVPVTSSTNYKAFELTISVEVTEVQIPVLTVNSIRVTYTGKPVPDSSISGTATVDGQTITGKWSFVKEQAITNVADSGPKEVTFTPDNTDEYGPNTSTVTVTIEPAALTGTPTFTPVTSSGKTLGDVTLGKPSDWPEGTFAWTAGNETAVEQNQPYQYTFTPENPNYQTNTGNVTLWVKSNDPTPPTPTVIPVKGVRLNRSTQTLEVGERFRLTATVEPANTTESTAVTWSSDNPTNVDVDSNGTVIALKPGTAVITVRTVSSGYTATCTVTVEAPKPETYTITYDANGGGTMEDGTATENAAFKLPECGFTAPDGKVFDAWAIGSLSGEKAAAGSSHTFTANTTVYALWKDAPAEGYTISYDANGGTGTMADSTAAHGEAFTLPGCSFTAPEGKIFDTWAIGSTDGTQVKAGDSHTFTANTTVYALWKDAPAVTYTIVYHANGGSGTMANSIVPAGEAYILPVCGFTAPEGKEFAGWSIGGTSGVIVEAGGSYTFTRDMTVYAVWKEIAAETCKITYNANGGTGTMAEATATKNVPFTLPECGFTAPAGKVFDTWRIGGTTGTSVKPGEQYTFTADTVVRAIWKDVSATYTITYDANGGSGTMAAGTATENVPFTLPECGFTAPAGKVFDRWHIGGTTGTSVQPGEQYTFTADTIVRAVWKDAPAVTYRITYDANGGTGTMAAAAAMRKRPQLLWAA